MLCPFQKIITKQYARDNEVIKDTETAIITKETFSECSTNCAAWNRLRGVCMLCYGSKSKE